MQHGRYDMAERELRQAVAFDPQDPLTHALLGVCISELGREREGVDACRHAIVLGPDLPFCHYALAAVLHDHGRYDEAMTTVREAIRLDPYHADAHALRGQLHLHDHDWKQAVAAADAALEIDAEHVAASNVRGLALTKLGRRDEAGATLDATLARNPENPTSHANRGWALLHANQPKKAMEHFAEALRLDPNLDWARAGIVEAMKARNPIYRVLLAYFLWMSRLSGRVQFGLIIGAFILIRVLRATAESNPALQPFVTPLVIAYVVFVFLTWTAEPLFNLLLRLNRHGRHALSREQTVAANWVGATLALALGCGTVALLFDLPGAVVGGIMFGLLVLPVAGIFKAPTPGRRRILILYVAVMALLASASVFYVVFFEPATPEGRVENRYDWGVAATGLFFLMFIAYVWLANLLFLKRR